MRQTMEVYMIMKAILICSGLFSLSVAIWSGLINITLGRIVNALFCFVFIGTLGIMAIWQATKDWSGTVQMFVVDDEDEDDDKKTE
jgi:hypothetical protein